MADIKQYEPLWGYSFLEVALCNARSVVCSDLPALCAETHRDCVGDGRKILKHSVQ